jgi:hypothetical protein
MKCSRDLWLNSDLPLRGRSEDGAVISSAEWLHAASTVLLFLIRIYIYTVYINGLNILLVLWMYYHYYVCMHYSRMYYLIVLYHGIWYNDILLFPINFDVGMIFCIGMLRSDYQKRQVDRLANPFQSFRGQLMSTDVNWCQLMSTEHCITIPTLHWFSLSGSSKRG